MFSNYSQSYAPLTRANIHTTPQYKALPWDVRQAIRVVSAVFPFRTNQYIVDHLIDWDKVPGDPMYQMTFPQRGMVSAEEFAEIAQLLADNAPRAQFKAAINRIHMQYNPHPAGQMTHNVPTLNGQPVPGVQHKYRETVLFFPAKGQTCHAYCSYCFRWAQFIGVRELKFKGQNTHTLAAYLRAHPEATDVLFTGGDPAIMNTRALASYIEPLLASDLAHVHNIRIGTKALAYWPQRFVTDDDADDLLRLFERMIGMGKHVAIMAHYSHPVELSTPIAQEAVRRLRNVGCEIRMQAPIIRHVNDDANTWTTMWREGVKLGAVPYYMFISRDTGPKSYFEIPLLESYQIFREAYSQVSGLGRTVRGPVMSATPGKVMIAGTTKIHNERVFVLKFLQGRNPDWVARPFFAKYDPEASWLFDLEPRFGAPPEFFDETANYSAAVSIQSA
ncbi:MAG: lysine 2,3-aminomutase [Anaerolineae bacterium]|nr:lysine 2,3-aminomutase [Anaerolineae bacterium]